MVGRLPGFTLEDSIPVEGDHIDAELRWKSAEVKALAGRWIKVRFELSGASLYAFGFVD